MRLLAAAVLALLPSASLAAMDDEADLVVRFEEGTGYDLFHIENRSTCAVVVRAVTIDLSGTVGGLVFDTEEGGGGVSASRPFEIRHGAEKVAEVAGGGDGEVVLTLRLDDLGHGERVVFSIDVDDFLDDSPWGQTQIAGPEFMGGTVTALLREPDGSEREASGRFGPDARAAVSRRNCVAA